MRFVITPLAFRDRGYYSGSTLGGMKVSVSLPDDDVKFLDALATELGSSRSGVLQEAIALLRGRQLTSDYAAAWAEWETSGGAEVWDAAAGDGLGTA